jgi:lysylphosphatidylglycerol synthetase-like protein (DUF2156 family)
MGRTIGELVVRYGGPVASGLLDPRYRPFSSSEVEGVVGYQESWGCAVALGDPVCGARDLARLTARFREHCAGGGRHTLFAAGSAQLAAIVCGWGGAAVEFGETLIFDPQLDPQAGPRGRELRKKVQRARRDGARVQEHRQRESLSVEQALDELAERWLAARHGLQMYLSRVRLFDPAVVGRRWFYARAGGRVVGVLTLLRLEARGGYLIEHLLAAPDAPVGTAELLVTECFALLGAEACRFATFGPAPAAQLGRVRNLGRASERFARYVFETLSRVFHLDGRSQFQRKFRVTAVEPAYLVFDPPSVGIWHALGVMRAFNVSVK